MSPTGVYERKKRPMVHTHPPDVRAAVLRDLALGTMTVKEVSAKHRIHLATVYAWKLKGQTQGTVSSASKAPLPHREPILRMKAEGMGQAEIARKLSLPISTVHYHFYEPEKDKIKGEVHNGNGHFQLNRHEATGIAYAEVERLIQVLAERLGVSASQLRPRLSELLGRAPIRGASGPVH